MKSARLLFLGVLLFIQATFPSATLRAGAVTFLGEWKPDLPLATARKSQTVGNRLYQIAGANGLLIFDVTDPNQPVQLGRYQDSLGTAEAVVIKDHYAFVAYGARELQVIDVQDPAAPFRAGGYYAPCGGGYGSNNAYSHDLIIDGNTVYLANGSCGVQIVDISQPETPLHRGSYQTPQQALKLSLATPILTVISAPNKWDLDISNPASPRLVSTGEAPALRPTVAEVKIAGRYAYVASHWHQFDVLDLIDPSRPVRVGGLALKAYLQDIALEGNILLIANYSDGVQIVDIADPANPKIIGNWKNGQNVWGVAISQNIAYVVARNLHMLDLTVPSAPRLLGVYPVIPYAYRVHISGHTAYLSKWNDGKAEVVDVSDPANPQALGSFDVTSYTIQVKNSRAYLAQDGGFSIFDVSNPSAPLLLGSYGKDIPNYYTRGLAVDGGFAFFGQVDRGLTVFDLGNPASPTLIDTYDTDGFSSGVDAAEGLLAVADSVGGLKVFRNNLQGLRLRLSSSSPTRTFAIIGASIGVTYVLERAESLTPATEWNQVATITLQSEVGVIQDNSPSPTAAFYRLREE